MGIFSSDEDWGTPCKCGSCMNYKPRTTEESNPTESYSGESNILKDITDCMAKILASILYADRLTLDEFDALCSKVCTDVNMQKYIRDLVAKHIMSYGKKCVEYDEA